MDTSTRRSVMAAIIASAMMHGVLLVCFMVFHVGHLVIPGERHRVARAFEVHEVEIPAQALKDEVAPVPEKVSTVIPPTPPKNMPEPGKVTDPSLLAEAPRPMLPDLPSGGVSDIAPKLASPPVNVSEYAAVDQAKITAEISKFNVQPDYNNAPAPTAMVPAADSTSLETGQPVSGSSGKQESGAGSTVPTLDQIQAQFKFTAPSIDPSLPAPVIVRLPSDILFDFDSAKLRPNAGATLDLALAYIKRFNRADVEVEGHTDTLGNDDYNMKLSTQRAESVMGFLQEKLTDPAYTWHSRGWGKSRPIINPQGSIEQQERNRRVEIVIRAVKS